MSAVQEAAVKEALAQLRAWTKAEGIFLFGNDQGAVDCDPSEEY